MNRDKRKMKSIRLFVGLPIESLELAEQLTALTLNNPIPGYKWTKTENFHITLCFIGNVDSGRITEIDKALTNFKMERFLLQPDKIKPVFRRKKLEMIWLTFKENVSFSACYNNLHTLLSVQQNHPPTAHLTLARVKPGYLKELTEQDFPDLSKHEFEASKFHLYESRPTPNGILYVPLKVYNFVPQTP